MNKEYRNLRLFILGMRDMVVNVRAKTLPPGTLVAECRHSASNQGELRRVDWVTRLLSAHKERLWAKGRRKVFSQR